MMEGEETKPSPLAGEGGPQGRMGGDARQRGGTSTRAKAFARTLRRSMTDAEKKLWWELRDRGVNKFKFRRQHPVGRYIADFCCLEARLIIEVDGGQHREEQRGHDDERTAWLTAECFRVVRFWNHEVLEDVDSVCEAVFRALNEQMRERSEPSKRERVLAARRRIYTESGM